MSEETPLQEQAEHAADPFEDMREAGVWLKMIAKAEKAFAVYQDKCDNIDKKYADLERLSGNAGEREMQLFWANLEVLKPSVYTRKPIPVVSPRFKSRKPLPRAAADVLERAMVTSFDMEDIHQTLKDVRDDLVTNGRGVPWVRYESNEEGGERVCYEHVDRKDFLHDPARKWKEVGWVARRSYLTKEKGEARFGEAWASVKLEEHKNKGADEKQGDLTGEVWEIWHKGKNAVVWVSPGQDAKGDVLDIQEPFLTLRNFFPCPRPAYGTLQRRSLIPVPDYVYYKDQIDEINELTARISALSEALKMKGFYAAGNSDVKDAVEAAVSKTDNGALLIPVANFAALGGAGLKDSILWMPVQEVASTVKELIALRQQLIQDVYQITGISDIMRGSTDAGETLGAQQLKSQYGNVRIKDRQEEMVRIAKECEEIAAEIIAENFSPETIREFSQNDDLPSRADIQQQVMQIQQQAQMAAADPEAMQQVQAQLEQLQSQVTFDDVVELLKSDRARGFMLDVETNSTVQPDEAADKQARSEALTAIGGFISQAGPMVMQQPETGTFVSETLKWLASGYRMGRPMDAAIDQFAETVSQAASQPKGPNPEAVKAEAEKAKADQEFQLKTRELDLKEQEIADRKADAEASRNHELDGKRVEAGLPPGYSFEDDRAQFKAIMEAQAQGQAATQQMIATIANNQNMLAQALQGLGQALMTPKSIAVVKDANGRVIGGTTEPIRMN